MLRTTRKRDESGAVAVMFGLLAVMLMSVAALGVDIGNEVNRHTVTQTQADFAALRGGDKMTAVGAVGSTVPSSVIDAIVTALNNNQPQDDNPAVASCVKTTSCVKASDLTDADMTNGDVRFTAAGLQVTAPNHFVSFGMARIMGFQGKNVNAQATIQIYSPGEHVLPYFAAQNCDYGTQTISQPTNGLDASTINLDTPGPPNNAALEQKLVTTPPSPVGSAGVPYPVPANTPLEIDGSGFGGVNMVGFFESGGASVGPPPVTLPVNGSMITNGGTKIVIPDISPANLSQDAWYVRVSMDGGTTWSAVGVGSPKTTLNALPLSVGSPNLVCATGSQTGNFGTLDLHNMSPDAPSGTGDNVAYNIAAGLSSHLAPYDAAASPWTCSKGGGSPSGTTIWPADPTNCIATQTGSVSGDDAYSGLVDPQWKNPAPTVPGLLTNLGPGSGCAANGTPTTAFFNNVKVNNDTLSCFFTDAAAAAGRTIGDVDTKNYTLSGPVFSTAIWSSPRFVWIPVIACPCTGNSTNYEVIAFRPAFITDQANSATKTTPLTSCTNTDCNGLTLGQNGHSIAPLQVVLLNIASLPSPPNGGPVSPYNGIGPPIVRLIN
jgi:hypothetical protein